MKQRLLPGSSPVTAIVLTKNNERSLPNTLGSLTWCREVIVIDSGSTDRTTHIAKSYAAKIITHKLANNFSQQRNLALEKASSPWVLFVDSDETIPIELALEITEVIENTDCRGFLLKRHDIFFGKKLLYGETASVQLVRLARKNAGKWIRPVHEMWEVSGKVETLTNQMLHYPHQSLHEFIDDINHYTTIEAQFRYSNGIKEASWRIVAYPVAKFIQNYIFRKGYKDGLPGFIMALMMSFHSYLVRVKLWQYWKEHYEAGFRSVSM